MSKEIKKGIKERWGWYYKALTFLENHGYDDNSVDLVELIALAMATEKHGSKVAYIDENGTERTERGTHCSGGRSACEYYG